jgi:glycosyltransferase involved in cell wall biosynthesis
MRIVHCLRAPVGGLFRHVLDLAGAQSALGHSVGLIADSEAVNALTEQRLDEIAPHLTLGIKRIAMHRLPAPSDFTAHAAVVAHVRGLSADIVHGHGAKGGAFARLAGRALKAQGQRLKTFYTPHGGTLNYAPGSLEGRFFMGLERVLDRFTDGLIFESAFAARVYGERIGSGQAPRRVVPNGLQPRDFVAQAPAATAADFLFIGELRELKGVDVLLRALSVLNAGRAAALRAVIVGAGPDGERFKALARELSLDGVVTFAGALPAAQAFDMGRTLVVPSRKESFPYIVLEAAAACMPLIATNVGGIPEIVAGTDTALIVAEDVDALAAAMAGCVDDPAAARAKALRLKDTVAERFTVDAMTRSILAFYQEA